MQTTLAASRSRPCPAPLAESSCGTVACWASKAIRNAAARGLPGQCSAKRCATAASGTASAPSERSARPAGSPGLSKTTSVVTAAPTRASGTFRSLQPRTCDAFTPCPAPESCQDGRTARTATSLATSKILRARSTSWRATCCNFRKGPSNSLSTALFATETVHPSLTLRSDAAVAGSASKRPSSCRRWIRARSTVAAASSWSIAVTASAAASSLEKTNVDSFRCDSSTLSGCTTRDRFR
mmetsp:Transcript_122942/g.244580  ORF Transcript_122942/g.244580 Transcript_122942/m.244580 type:complete len:240 (-) Transcript_122942:1141-1860(-)